MANCILCDFQNDKFSDILVKLSGIEFALYRFLVITLDCKTNDECIREFSKIADNEPNNCTHHESRRLHFENRSKIYYMRNILIAHKNKSLKVLSKPEREFYNMIKERKFIYP